MIGLGEGLPLRVSDAGLNSNGSSAGRSATSRTSGRAEGNGPSTGNESAPGIGRREATDRRVAAYEQAGKKIAAAGGGTTTDAQTAAVLARLKTTDAAVRAHEAAHIAAGGSLVSGAASFTYQKGPDGRQYAVGGEVGIDTSPVGGDPQATIQKMETVRAAALAPSDPSAQDRAVAVAASQAEAKARAELAAAQAKELGAAYAPAKRAAVEAPSLFAVTA